MTDSLIERVARAFWGDEYDGSEYQLRGARAAIKAMREPTKAMRVAGNAAGYDAGINPDRALPVCWKAMIDAALGEKQ